MPTGPKLTKLHFGFNYDGRVFVSSDRHRCRAMGAACVQSFRLDLISAVDFYDERRAKGQRLKYIAFDYSGRRQRLTEQITDEEGAALLAGPLRSLGTSA